MVTSNFTLPPLPALKIHYSQVAQGNFKLALDNYSLAAELNEKSEAIQVTTLLTDIVKEA